MADEKQIISALGFSYGEKIARWCQTPRTTAEIKVMYEAEERKSRVMMVGGFGFEGYLQQLEEAGAIVYTSGKWQTTPTALEVLAKYFG